MKTQRLPFIDRRHFLRGLGMALALPAFESLNVGFVAAAPKTDPRRLICIGNHLGFWPGGFFPTAAGREYAISKTLAPLQAHRGDFTVFSHLDHDAKGGHGAVHSFLTGVKKEEAAGFPEKNISIDQVAAEHVGAATRYPSITAGLGEGTDMCWNRAGVRLPPVTNPARLFEALFVEANAGAKATECERLSNRASVLDALRESAKQLGGTLDAADRSKLDQYLTSVRDVERRLQMSEAWLGKPKPKSPIDAIKDEERLQIEEIPLFMDLMTLALQTDSTRVATFEVPLGFHTTELDVGSYHGLSHHSKQEGLLTQLQIVEKYLMTQFAHLFGKLKEAGLMDSTLVVIGSGMGNASNHSNRDLPVLLAGGGLKHQGHLVCPAEERKRIQLSNLWLSTLQWFGAERERFGRSTGTFTPMTIG
ncbi:MAG: DUF1552 domain-containing protein [Planctomycetota bacterium]|nr:MAG: DUF1552 domain-containing protein [Planctomycetota bacterium]